jgi:hypothetical protein
MLGILFIPYGRDLGFSLFRGDPYAAVFMDSGDRSIDLPRSIPVSVQANDMEVKTSLNFLEASARSDPNTSYMELSKFGFQSPMKVRPDLSSTIASPASPRLSKQHADSLGTFVIFGSLAFSVHQIPQDTPLMDLVFRGSNFKKGMSDGPMFSRDFFWSY